MELPRDPGRIPKVPCWAPLNATLESPALMTLMFILGCEISRGSGFKPKVQKEIKPSQISEAHAQTIQQMASLVLFEGHRTTRQASSACFCCVNYRTLEHIFSVNSTFWAEDSRNWNWLDLDIYQADFGVLFKGLLSAPGQDLWRTLR